MSIVRPVFSVCVLVFVSASLTPAVAQSDITRSTMVARVENDTITVYDVVRLAWDRRMLKKEPVKPERAQLNDLVQELLFETLVIQEAEAIDLSQDWEYRRRERMMMTQVASQLFQDEEFIFRLNIDSVAVDSYYHAHIERFTVPRPQRHMRQITVYKKGKGIPEGYIASSDTLYTGWDPKRKIDSLYTRLQNGEDFSTLAALYSEEPRARSLHGDWGWVSREGLADPEVADHLFSQPLHLISKPIELPFGWMILQVLGEREAGATPLDAEVKATVENWLMRTQGQALATRLVDSLLDAADIVYLDENIALPDTAIELGTPLIIYNGTDTLRGEDYLYTKRNTSGYSKQLNVPVSERRELLDRILRTVALFAGLRDWGYLDRPSVKEVQARERHQRVRDIIKNELTRDLHPDSAAIADYYRSHLKDFTPERRHFIYYRVFTSPDSAAAVADEWRQGTLPSNARSQWVKADDLPTKIWNRIASVTEGEVIGPIAVNSDDIWAVKLERIAQAKSLRTVQSSIISRIRDERNSVLRDQWIRDASRRYTVVRRDDVLSRLVYPSKREADSAWFADLIEAKQALEGAMP